MSAPAPRLRARTRTERPPLAFYAVNAAFLLALAAIGAGSAWPIYANAWFVLTVAVAVAAGTAIAFVGMLRGWRWWWLAAWLAGAYLVLGIPLAVPSAIADPGQLPGALLRLTTAPVTGWKDLLTLQLPLGTYQATLAPALLVFLVVPAVALSLAWRAERTWALAAPVALLLPVFGILFGSSAVAGALVLGPLQLTGTVQLALGLAALLVALGWYVWRIRYARTVALRKARNASNVRVVRQDPAAIGRWAIAGAMVVVAAIVGVVAAPLALAGQSRDVLRTAVDPDLRVRTELSPLTTYRQFFADDAYDQVLFTVDAPPEATRVRLATLSFYDGVVARVMDPDAGVRDTATAFQRVPATLAPVPGTPVTASISIGAYTGTWVPTVGTLTAIDFDGTGRTALTDGFFYSAPAQMGVELADPGLQSGVAYRQSAIVSDAPADPAALTPPDTAPRVNPSLVPQSLRDWIEAQDAPTGGAGLAELVKRLRERGYLSHAVAIDPARPPAWVSGLGDYTFQPSRAGHSTDRVGALFTALLQRQNEVGADGGAALVAGVGDDEQFAVAAALLADQLGFPARIVLGARLSADGDGDVAACQDGACRGADMAAWIEVQDASGAWAPIDVTPQHERPVSPDVQQRRDPQNMTEVDPQNAQAVLPPESNPVERGEEDPQQSAPADLSGLWTALRIAGVSLLVLLVLLGPFAAVLVAKVLRRRARRRAPDPVDRVTGGWDEYVDSAVDSGGTLPRTQTRQELAALYEGVGADAGGSGIRLATWADRSVFAPDAPSDADAIAFWELVDAERERLRRGGGWWTRLRARLSLRSFRRVLGPATRGRSPRDR